MPQPSTHSSSEFANAETNSSFYDRTEAKAHEVTEDTRDLFYSTEELLDTLPRPWTRPLLYSLIGFVAVVLPWTMLSKVDETGSARGRIEPLEATLRLDSPANGSVTSVRVKEGETVKAGQILLELDSDLLRNELQQIQAKLQGLHQQQAQQELLKSQLGVTINQQEQQNLAQESEKLAQVNQAQQNIDDKESAYNFLQSEKLALVEQARHSLNSSQTAKELSDSRLNADLTEFKRYRSLFELGVIPQIKLVELQKTVSESQRLWSQAKSDTQQAQLRLQEEQTRYQTIMSQALSNIKQAKLRLQEQQSSYESVVRAGKLAVLKNQEQLKQMQTQMTALQSEILQTKSQIASINLQLRQRVIRAPHDGVVFALPIEKPGAVLQTGQMIAQIAQKNSSLVLKASMPSTESGFLKVGKKAKVKFDAYPFQEYGVIQGRVIWVSPNSLARETIQGKIDTFELKIALDQPYILAGNKRIPLTSGQTATAEVIIRQRRLFDFFLDPFKKLQKGGLDL